MFGHTEQLCRKSPREMPGGSAAGSVRAAGPSGCQVTGCVGGAGSVCVVSRGHAVAQRQIRASHKWERKIE